MIHHRAGLIKRDFRKRFFFSGIGGLVSYLGAAETGADIAAIGTSAGALGAAGPVVGGAVTGAATGAGTAAATGGNIGQGALLGGITGGVTGGIGEFAPNIFGGVFGGTPDAGAVTAPATTGAGDLQTAANIGGSAAPPTAASPVASIAGGGTAPVDLTAAANTAAPLTPDTSGLPAGTSAGGGANIPSSNLAGAANTATGTPFSAAATTTPGFNYDASTIGKILNSAGITTAGQDPGIIASTLAKNPQALLSGGGLLFNLLQNSQPKGLNQLTSEAGAIAAEGSQLESYVNSGTLPPGAQTALNQAVSSAKAQVRSKFSAMGQSGSTAEQQALQQIDINAVGQQFQIADQLLTAGLNETNLSANLYADLTKINQATNASTGSAISSFAAALAGTSPGLTLKLAA